MDMIKKHILPTLLFLGIILSFPLGALAKSGGFDASDVKTNGAFSMDKAKRGATVQAAVIIEIPDGYHVNSNKPLGKFAIPTQLRVSGPNGIRSGPVIYPRSALKTFSFSQEKLSVFEGRAVLRFTVNVPAGYKGDALNLHARLRFQSCTNEVCFPPDSRDIEMHIQVVDATEPTKSINSGTFGRRR